MQDERERAPPGSYEPLVPGYPLSCAFELPSKASGRRRSTHGRQTATSDGQGPIDHLWYNTRVRKSTQFFILRQSNNGHSTLRTLVALPNGRYRRRSSLVRCAPKEVCGQKERGCLPLGRCFRAPASAQSINDCLLSPAVC
jgi:hypothetical protein